METSSCVSGCLGADSRTRSTTTVSPASTCAAFDRLESRRALPQTLERLVDGVLLDDRRRPAQLQRRVVAGIERRHRFEVRRELQRLAFLDQHVADVRRVNRLHAPLPQRIVHRARDQIVHDVVQDLIAEALPDDLRRHLSGPEAGIRAALL